MDFDWTYLQFKLIFLPGTKKPVHECVEGYYCPRGTRYKTEYGCQLGRWVLVIVKRKEMFFDRILSHLVISLQCKVNVFNMDNGRKQMNSHFELALINRSLNKMMSSDLNKNLLNPFCVMQVCSNNWCLWAFKLRWRYITLNAFYKNLYYVLNNSI